jgi:HSP20 family protein
MEVASMNDEQQRPIESGEANVGDRERYGSSPRTQRGGGSGMVQRRRDPGSQVYERGYPAAHLSSPWELMRRMSEDLDRLFETFQPSRVPGTESYGSMWAPELEMERRGNELRIRADLPGLKPEDVELSLDDGILTIAGERRQEKRDDREGVLRSERSYGRFVRSIQVPDAVQESDISATFRNGVLEITLPVPERKQRKIQIKQ